MFLWFFNVFDILPSWHQLRVSCSMLCHLGVILSLLGTILGSSPALLEPSWSLLRPSCELRGGLLGLLRAILAPSWLVLGPPGTSPGPSQAPRTSQLAALDALARPGTPCGPILRARWSPLGPQVVIEIVIEFVIAFVIVLWDRIH